MTRDAIFLLAGILGLASLVVMVPLIGLMDGYRALSRVAWRRG